jgi:hypothetical protein
MLVTGDAIGATLDRGPRLTFSNTSAVAATATPAPVCCAAPPAPGNVAPPPPPGGLTLVVAGTTDVQSLIDAQPFEVLTLFVFDIAAQKYKGYVVGAPAFVQTLTSLRADDPVAIRRK